MTKTELQFEISAAAYDIEDYKAFLRLETDPKKRKELNDLIEETKKQYIALREKLDNGEYEEDEEDEEDEDKYAIQRWLDHEEDARIAETYASCSGSY